MNNYVLLNNTLNTSFQSSNISYNSVYMIIYPKAYGGVPLPLT